MCCKMPICDSQIHYCLLRDVTVSRNRERLCCREEYHIIIRLNAYNVLIIPLKGKRAKGMKSIIMHRDTID